MAEPVCIARDRDDDGTAIPAEWSDTDTVLAFAADLAARLPRAVGYVRTAPEHGPALPQSTYSAELARRHDVHGSISGVDLRTQGTKTASLRWSAYGLRIGCDKCTEHKAREEREAVRAAERAAMREIPHDFTSTADYMASCDACGESRAFEAHTWAAHAYSARWGRCGTCGRNEDDSLHGVAA
jgi:hypothetical protein